MIRCFIRALLATVIFLGFSEKSDAQSLEDIGFSGVFFLSYEHDVFEDSYENDFNIKRGYITFRKAISDRLEIRFTQDVTIDQQGDGMGDIELRLKYALVKYRTDDFGFISSPSFEAGVVNRPWINFEQDVNDYRSQKSMFLDQNNILSSADYGVQFEGGLGPELPEEKQRNLSTIPGRWGSIATGIYNGGGYSELEFNNNKLLEASASLRPLPDQLPGFQTSFFGTYGKGNIPESPDFNMIGSALTYESAVVNAVIQGFRGEGDSSGRFTNPDTFEAHKLEGWSAFMELKPFEKSLSATLRYDELYNRDLDRLSVRQWITGLSYVFPNRSKLIVDVSRNQVDTVFNQTEFTRVEIVGEVRF